MPEVVRVPEKVSGVKDAVELKAKCCHTTFYSKKMGQTVLDCSIKASWENGVVSIGFTHNGKHQSIGVRMDEMLAIMKAASEARSADGQTDSK